MGSARQLPLSTMALRRQLRRSICISSSFTLRPETFRLLIEDCVDSGLAHGFTEIVLLASHGTNFAPLERLAGELAEKKGAKIVCGMKLTDFMDLYSEGERMFGLEKGACGGHACCFDPA